MALAREAMVKKTKKEWKSIVRDQMFAVKALFTFLIEVESIINSRPLTETSDDVNDLELITPYCLFICNWCPNYHLRIFQEQKIRFAKKWKAVQAASDIFWKRWMKKYLPKLKEKVDKRKTETLKQET